MPDDTTPPTTEATPAGTTVLDAGQAARFHTIAAERLDVDVETAGALLTATDPDALLGQFERLSTIVAASHRRTPRPDLSQGARGTTSPGTPAEVFADFMRRAT